MTKQHNHPRLLGHMSKGEKGTIARVGGTTARGTAPDSQESLVQRLLEMGLLEGSEVELVHEAPFGGDPIAVRVRGALIALRRAEADQIEVL